MKKHIVLSPLLAFISMLFDQNRHFLCCRKENQGLYKFLLNNKFLEYGSKEWANRYPATMYMKTTNKTICSKAAIANDIKATAVKS